VRIEIAGAPRPEVAAAIIAAIESVVGERASEASATVSPWRRAAIRDNLRTMDRPGAGVAWNSPSPSL
jgi:hypothetical protein